MSCSIPLLGWNEKQRRSEGEADFVILHPALGIFSVEVKPAVLPIVGELDSDQSFYRGRQGD